MRTNDWVGKRKAARQPVNMRAEIRFLDGRPPVECRITDISSTGCAVELKTEIPDLEDFDLFIEARGETKICKLRRGGGTTLGVAFLKSRLDDPLVMQTLMERVLRLERGFAEMKGAPPSIERGSSEEERRVSGEARRTADRELEFSGPSIDQRIQALAAGLAEMRSAVDRLSNASTVPAPADFAPRLEAQGSDIAALKQEMAALSKTLRSTLSAPSGGVSAALADLAPAQDHTDDIAVLKREMASLSVAMREIAASPAMRSQPAATLAPAPEMLTRDIAKVRADVSELRAAMEALQSTPNGRAPTPLVDYSLDIADLRDRVEGALDNAPNERLLEFANAIGALRAEMGALKAQRGATLDQAVQRELVELRGAVKTMIAMLSKTLNEVKRAA